VTIAGLVVGLALLAVLIGIEVAAVRRAVVSRTASAGLWITAGLAAASATLILPRLADLLT
jgi:hypothetical protein